MENEKELKERAAIETCEDIFKGVPLPGMEKFKNYKGASEMMKGVIIAEIYRLRRDNDMLRKEIKELNDKRQTDILEIMTRLKR